MKLSNKWWLLLPVMMVCIIAVVSGCKKDDKVPAIQFSVKNYYPNSGQAGTLVTVEGEGFSSSLGQYKAAIAGVDAEVISATEKAVVVRMPVAGKTGSLTLSYQNKNYEVGQYTYQALTLTKLFPANGPAGSQIRISGAGFSSVKEPAKVFVNNKAALIVSATDTLIVAEIPAAAGSGAVLVRVDGMEVKGQNFRFQAVDGIRPLTGGANTRVTITGSGFEELIENNIVDFNGKKAVVESVTETQLVVLAPAGVETGPLSVNIDGQKITGPAFTVVGKPVIKEVTPLSGPKGAEMTITGDIFSELKEENKVFINNVEVPLQMVNKTQMKLLIPGGTGSGKIRVVVNDQATEGPQFKDQTLGISALTPDNGLAGTNITITGTGFSAVAAENTVSINGIAIPVKTATETSLVLEAPSTISTGEVKVIAFGQEAIAPRIFRRAGVLTLAGGPGSNALGNYATTLAVDSKGNVYVCDKENNVVKKITPEGVVSVLQANGADITFQFPAGIAIDKNDNIFVSDGIANQIRKITPAGQNILYSSGFAPTQIAVDDAGILYVGISGFGVGMNKVNTTGSYSKIAGPSWVMYRPATDAAGNLYYPDQNLNGNNGLNRISAAGSNQLFVGGYYDDAGYADGIGSSARFNGISGVALRNANELLIADANNVALRMAEISSLKVTTLAKFGRGYKDGTLSEAQFGQLTDIAVGKDGSIYILDANNKAVRKIFLQ